MNCPRVHERLVSADLQRAGSEDEIVRVALENNLKLHLTFEAVYVVNVRCKLNQVYKKKPFFVSVRLWFFCTDCIAGSRHQIESNIAEVA